MSSLLLKFSLIEDIKKIHPRHIIQSIIVFTCFCTLDSLQCKSEVIWLSSTFFSVLGIFGAFLLSNYIINNPNSRFSFGKWTNALCVIVAILVSCCEISEIFLPFALLFVTFLASIRVVYARINLNDYCTVFFIVVSVFIGITLKFLLVLLPIWVTGAVLLLSLFYPTISQNPSQKLIANIAKSETPQERKINYTKLIAGIILVVFLLSIEVFGGPLTSAVQGDFPMNAVNISYLFGFILTIVAIMTIDIKTICIGVMSASVTGLFFFLIPLFSTFGIYFLLFIGGAIKVLMIAFPVAAFSGNAKLYGAFGGVFIYRLAFFVSRLSEVYAGESWVIDSNFTYIFAAINIVLALVLIFFLLHWDRKSVKSITEERLRAQLYAPRQLPSEFSLREKEVAKLILDGLTSDEIATRLFIADSTARTHIKSILRKSDCSNQRMFIVKYTSPKE